MQTSAHDGDYYRATFPKFIIVKDVGSLEQVMIYWESFGLVAAKVLEDQISCKYCSESIICRKQVPTKKP